MGFTKYSTCSSAVALVLTLLGAAVVLTLQPASAQVFSSCTASMLSTFTPCLNYLTGSSNGGSSPTADCCDAVGGLLSSSTDCACLILTGNIPFRIPINRTLAVSLPRVCSSKSVSLFQCNGPPPGSPAGGSSLPALPPSTLSTASMFPPPVSPESLSPAAEPSNSTQPDIEGLQPLLLPNFSVTAAVAGGGISLLVPLAAIAALLRII